MNQTSEEIKIKISFLIKILDLLRTLFGLQTKLAKLKTELMVRTIAKNYNVDVDVLVAVIWAESNMDPNCITRNPNGTTDYGLCQFNDYWYRDIIQPQVALKHPEVAVNVMCQMWEKGKQSDWISWRNKSYIEYLNVKT